jgi:acetylornithine/succinyldiaminopimelate/putrescine aminotransferase
VEYDLDWRGGASPSRQRAPSIQRFKHEKCVLTRSVGQLIEARQAEQYSLYRQSINTSLARAQAIIGFDKFYTRGQGSYFSLGLRAAWTATETVQKGLFAQFVVMALMQEHHTLTQVSGPDIDIIRLLPPLNIGDKEVEMIVSSLDAVMAEAMEIRGAVWAQSVRLTKHALQR